MRAELQIELRRPLARVAFAARRQRHRATAARERKVGRLERLEQSDPVDRLPLWGDAKDGVALELGQPQRGTQAVGDRAQEVSENVMRMLELYTSQVSGVAADVGEH